MAHKLLIMVICAVIIGGGFVSGMPSLASDYYPIRPPRPPLLHDNFEAGDPLIFVPISINQDCRNATVLKCFQKSVPFLQVHGKVFLKTDHFQALSPRTRMPS